MRPCWRKPFTGPVTVAPPAANEIFNVSNGDCFMWEQVFPAIAKVFVMECATPHAMSLGRVMADKGPIWDRIVEKHQLQPYKMAQLVPSFEYADFLRSGINKRPTSRCKSTIKNPLKPDSRNASIRRKCSCGS